MKDAYSFHLHDACLVREYENMKSAYSRIFTRLGLDFRMVQADSGAIGGDASQEFHVIAESGEDALVFSTGSDYAANMEAAIAAAPGERPAASEALRRIDTPTQKTCEAVAALLGLGLERTVKSVAIMSEAGFVLALVCGDHDVNEIKLGKVEGLQGYRMASEAEIATHLGSEPGFLGRSIRPSRSASWPTATSPRWPISSSVPTKPVPISPASTGAATCPNRKWRTSATPRPVIVPPMAVNSRSRAASKSAMCSSSAASMRRR